MRTRFALQSTLVVPFVYVAVACGQSPVSPTAKAVSLAIQSIVPNTGAAGESFPLRINGTGFRPGVSVSIGGVAVTPTFASSSTLTAIAPALDEGAVDVVVSNPDGLSARLERGFTYVTLNVTAVVPARSVIGTWVRIEGTGLHPQASVTFDGAAARVVADPGVALFALAPPHSPGLADIVITNPGGRQVVVPAAFTYQPIVLSASPAIAAPAGDLFVTWEAPTGRPALDWIGLFKVGASNTAYISYEYTNGAASGTLKFRAPAETGEYEFRYLVDDEYNDAARTAVIRIAASSR
jgi:hypothetical protein